MARLRRDIEEVASRETYMGEQMPIKWLRFEQAVTKLVEEGTYFASLDQVRDWSLITGRGGGLQNGSGGHVKFLPLR